jgi:hypothetical protein
MRRQQLPNLTFLHSHFLLVLLILGVSFKFYLKFGVEESIVNALRITVQLFKSYVFTRLVRSQSTLQRQL